MRGNTSAQKASTAQFVCYGEQPLQYYVGINELAVDIEKSGFVEYNSTSRQFTVVKPFKAIITSWVLNYQGGSQYEAQGELYINNQQVAFYYSGSTARDAKNGAVTLVDMSIGDTIDVRTPSDNGWPAQRIKIYKIESISAADTFINSTKFENEFDT